MNKRAIFISYSWEEEEHQAWVKKFSDDLQSLLGNDYEVLLDQNLPKGFPITRFMEIGIEKSERVLIIGTPMYKQKSQTGKGVAFEHTIISNEMMENIDTTKYYPILRRGSFTVSFPSALNGRNGDDFRNDKNYIKNLKIVANAIINENPIPDIFKQDSTAVTTDKVIEQQKGKNQKVIDKPTMEAERSIASLNGVVFSNHKTMLDFVPKYIKGSFIIPNSVTEIGKDSFRDCTSLTSIKIPESVTKIGKYAFSGCTDLTSIEIPDSVTEIGECAFKGCSSLISIKVHGSVTKIEDGAFRDCPRLTSIYISNSVKEIEGWAFRGCSSLTSIEIPGSVTKIGKYAFSGCTSLTSIDVPSSVTEIGESAFNGCTSLISIKIPESVTEIGDGAFNGCINLVELHIRRMRPFFQYDSLKGLYISKITLYVPKVMKKDYKESYIFRNFGEIVGE